MPPFSASDSIDHQLHPQSYHDDGAMLLKLHDWLDEDGDSDDDISCDDSVEVELIDDHGISPARMIVSTLSPVLSSQMQIPMGMLLSSLSEDEQEVFLASSSAGGPAGIVSSRRKGNKSVSFAECDDIYSLPPIDDDVLSTTVMSPADHQMIQMEAMHLIAYMNHADAGMPSSTSDVSSCLALEVENELPCLRGLEGYTDRSQIRAHGCRQQLYEIVGHFQQFLDDVHLDVLSGDLLAEFLHDTGVSSLTSEEATTRALQDRIEVVSDMATDSYYDAIAVPMDI